MEALAWLYFNIATVIQYYACLLSYKHFYAILSARWLDWKTQNCGLSSCSSNYRFCVGTLLQYLLHISHFHITNYFCHVIYY